ncbi:hypothetical protein [Glutamicibacter protophormiae]|uniref:TrbL/VirB6 plasmid conjugal transfer protein n=1 Tax=Glutamicibacter protophormiae TaxID=37930 RepID=A0ABS4XVF0_GLUPR|nr:hypothetical protein [Glutamicibacter protophormiae]MBP2400489.1 hypothetical protein [Glutamicibacter protophormiae]GGM01232.1 hypothetical protein GCM10010038_34090 [Glutamicibacter protophormiae]
MANSECRPWDLICKGGEGLKNLADSAITDFVKSLYDGAVAFVAQVSTFWMDTASPDVNNAAVTSLRADMSWYVAGFAILGFFIGLIKLVTSQDVKNSLIGLATPIVNLILATTAYAVGIGVLLKASDEFSRWIVERSTGGDVDLTQMLTSGTALLASPGTAFLLFILLLLGAVINLLFMYFRDVMFLILSAFIVVLAAGSGSEQGRQAWRKANGWLVALLLFKPVAAGIYSLGFRMLVQGSAPEGEEATVTEAMHSTLIALLILLLAALALPALIKFIVPAAGVGAGAFSGGAALGAGVTLAAGAAVLAGTGGAAAAAGGAGAAASSGSGAAAAGGGSTAAGAAGGGAGAGTGAGGGTGGASESVSGAEAGSSASGDTGSGAGSSSGSSSAGGSTGPTGSGSSGTGSTGTGSTGSGSTSSGASAGTAGANNSAGSASSGSGAGDAGSASQSANAPQEHAPSTGGPSGAKAPNKLNEAMQKMGDVKGLTNGANPSKLVNEDGE